MCEVTESHKKMFGDLQIELFSGRYIRGSSEEGCDEACYSVRLETGGQLLRSAKTASVREPFFGEKMKFGGVNKRDGGELRVFLMNGEQVVGKCSIASEEWDIGSVSPRRIWRPLINHANKSGGELLLSLSWIPRVALKPPFTLVAAAVHGCGQFTRPIDHSLERFLGSIASTIRTGCNGEIYAFILLY